ncbi:MAG TPA: class I SAM-dependent methyltransferase [Geomonas sp.]|nr:class I SAM-dependent methyltransferase [Geomonas sp.]
MTSKARSFRDPAGRLFFIGNDPIRQVFADAAAGCRKLIGGAFFQDLMCSGQVVKTRSLVSVPGHLSGIARDGELLLAHEAIPFQSFPAEWPIQMLQAAALLTLDIAEQGIGSGIGLKDATPYNVLFDGPRPVFVDVLSFEERDPLDPVWLAQGQFMRTFLLPLLAASKLGVPLSSVFLTRRDGLEPAEIYRMITPLRRISAGFLSTVSMPVWLSGKAEAGGQAMYRPRRLQGKEQASFVLKTLIGGLRRKTARLAGKGSSGPTRWSDYCRTCSYDQDSFQQKSSFVDQFLQRCKPARVLDIGCNTGHFSRLAASRGAQVVAIDQDAAVVGTLFEEARARKLDILPLVVDFARPTPATGWNNEENPSFLTRARGRFEAVFMLALIHHLVVTDQIPLAEVLAVAARVSTRYLVIEYVPPEDPQFQRLVRGREALYRHLTREHFEKTAADFFTIVQSSQVENQERWLYVMEKRNVQ